MKDKTIAPQGGVDQMMTAAMSSPIVRATTFTMGIVASVSACAMLLLVKWMFATDLKVAVIGCVAFSSTFAIVVTLVQRSLMKRISPDASIKAMYENWYGQELTVASYISRTLRFMGVFQFSGLIVGLGVVYYFWGAAAASSVIACALLTTPAILASIWIMCKK
jgi:hypothetical protein